MKLDLRSNPRRDGRVASPRGREPPRQRRRPSRLGERFGALDDVGARNAAVRLDDKLQLDDSVALGTSRVRNIGAAKGRRRCDRGCVLGERGPASDEVQQVYGAQNWQEDESASMRRRWGHLAAIRAARPFPSSSGEEGDGALDTYTKTKPTEVVELKWDRTVGLLNAIS
jgi:hypothetical protein